MRLVGEKPFDEAIMIEDSIPVLKISDLKTYFFTEGGVVKAVDGIDLVVYPGEIHGVVGESGCGKSVTSLSILRLVNPPGRIVKGEICFQGKDLLELSDNEMADLRGDRISMIFQQPQTSLNPVLSVGTQVAEVLKIHQRIDDEAAWQEAIRLLKLVEIPNPEQKAHCYPHEMSGGQAQRVMIAIALALKPELLIADEPTTALDVTIQAQILDLIREKNRILGTAVILITHDLGVVAEMADYVSVMYAGVIVECAPVDDLFNHPFHPYTLGLLNSLPVLGVHKNRLDVISGIVPNLVNLPPGCSFAPRCSMREKYNLKKCTQIRPPLVKQQPKHEVACWLYEKGYGYNQ
jgi:oligopeptide/dipeptide ABC transporter ATP-binding protein